jgi:hypothetical protein
VASDKEVNVAKSDEKDLRDLSKMTKGNPDELLD